MNTSPVITVWTAILSIAFSLYLIYSIFVLLAKIGKDYTIMTSKTSLFHKRLRKYFYLSLRFEIRAYIIDYCRRYSHHEGSTVEAIIMHEIDLEEYRNMLINEGYKKLFITTLTKMEEIKKFVDEWKEVNYYLTSSEMLELYLNETKPKNNGDRSRVH